MEPPAAPPLLDNPVNVALALMLVISIVVFLVRRVRARGNAAQDQPETRPD